MAHPFNDFRQHHVEHSRVARIAPGRASGGRINSDEAEDKALVKRMVHEHEKHMHKGEKETALKAHGGKVKHRLDRVKRASGGRVGKGKTNVTINVLAGGDKGTAPVPLPAPVVATPPMPPRPPMMPPVAAGAPPGLNPPMGAPPIRKDGGRAYAKGGKVGPAYEEGIRNATKVMNSPGKNDQKDVFRPKQVTYKTGGRVEAGLPPIKMRYGAGGEKGREEKIRKYGGK